jgi:hypothetical protein
MFINSTGSMAARSDGVHAQRSILGSSITQLEPAMHTELHRFLSRFIGTVILTLIPVIIIAFVSMPISLNRHPGEPAPTDLPFRHMT